MKYLDRMRTHGLLPSIPNASCPQYDILGLVDVKGVPMRKPAIILTLVFVTVTVWGQSSSYDESIKKQLVGAPGFFVFVSVSPDSLAALLPVSSIQTDVELRLRIAHIAVLTTGQSLNSQAGTIFVSVRGTRTTNTPIWAVGLETNCLQSAHLSRDPQISTTGLTWADGGVVLCLQDQLSVVRDDIKDLIDKFVNLYLAANP